MSYSNVDKIEVLANNQDIIQDYDKYLKNHLGCLGPEFARAYIVNTDANLNHDGEMYIATKSLITILEAYRKQLKILIELAERRKHGDRAD